MFGYVVVDDNNVVKRVVNNEEFQKFKLVSDVENYKEGEQYPIRTKKDMEEQLNDYKVAECRFVDGINDKLYVFRDYYACEEGDYALADTVYGPQIVKVEAIHDRGKWKGITPTKDIIDSFLYEAFEERQGMRKKLKELEAKKTEKKKDDVKIYHLDEKEFDDVTKYILKIFGDFTK